MEKGTSLGTRIVTSSLSLDKLEQINKLIKELSTYNFQKPDFTKDIEKFEKNLTETDFLTIRSYTGYNFRNINAILRNNWNYENNGALTEEAKEKYLYLSHELDSLISKFPSINTPFISYRGTTIKEFSKYNIKTIDELLFLKGKYLYEEGFTSTSLTEENSYFNKNINGENINIEIKYIVPNKSNDGIPLLTNNLSYSSNQEEYLLNRNTLSRVLDVKIDNDTAIITVLVIPKSLWNHQEKEINNRK